MPNNNNQDKAAKEYMMGILNHINSSSSNKEQLSNLLTFLNEKDRRRSTSWKIIFPWLKQFIDNV